MSLVVWRVDATAGFDAAWITVDGARVSAAGRAVGQIGDGWIADYALETDAAGVTIRFDVTVRDGRGGRTLRLHRGPHGWTENGQGRPDLTAALDVDLASCPATNTMPIVRLGLHRGPGRGDLLMAFVELPSLAVIPHPQRYEHLAVRAEGALVRYASEGFTADLAVDADGVVVDYPRLASRIPAR